MYPLRMRAFIREHPEAIHSESDLREYYRRVSSAHNLERLSIPKWAVIIGVPLTMFSVGVFLNFTGSNHSLVELPALAVIWFDLSILLFLLFWGERRLFETLTEIRPAFDVEDEKYYRFVGQLFQRLYEPSPFAAREEEIRVHVLAVISYALTFGLLLFISTQLPEQLIVVDGSGPSLALQMYVLLTIGFVSFGIYHGFWSTGCIVWFMGVRAAEFPLRFNVIRSWDNLGLNPYGTFILRVALIGFSGLIGTGFVYLVSPHPLLMAVTVFGSVLLFGWYIGAQIGLHKSMSCAKKDHIDRLTNEYRVCTDQWLDSAPSEVDGESIVKTHCVIEIKRELEKLSTWPGNIAGVIKLGSATFVSHFPFYLSFLNIV